MGAADDQQQHQHAQQPPTSTTAPALPPLTPINVNDRRASIARTVDLATGEASPVTSAGWHRRFSVGEYYGRDGGSGVRATPSPGPTLFPVAEASGRSSATAGAPPPGYMIVDLDRDGADATDAHHFQQKLLALGLSTKSSRAADRVRGFFAVRRNRYLCCGALSFIVLTVLALFITFYAVVPGYFQETFSTFSTNVAW